MSCNEMGMTIRQKIQVRTRIYAKLSTSTEKEKKRRKSEKNTFEREKKLVRAKKARKKDNNRTEKSQITLKKCAELQIKRIDNHFTSDEQTKADIVVT